MFKRKIHHFIRNWAPSMVSKVANATVAAAAGATIAIAAGTAASGASSMTVVSPAAANAFAAVTAAITVATSAAFSGAASAIAGIAGATAVAAGAIAAHTFTTTSNIVVSSAFASAVFGATGPYHYADDPRDALPLSVAIGGTLGAIYVVNASSIAVGIGVLASAIAVVTVGQDLLPTLFPAARWLGQNLHDDVHTKTTRTIQAILPKDCYCCYPLEATRKAKKVFLLGAFDRHRLNSSPLSSVLGNTNPNSIADTKNLSREILEFLGRGDEDTRLPSMR